MPVFCLGFFFAVISAAPILVLATLWRHPHTCPNACTASTPEPAAYAHTAIHNGTAVGLPSYNGIFSYSWSWIKVLLKRQRVCLLKELHRSWDEQQAHLVFTKRYFYISNQKAAICQWWPPDCSSFHLLAVCSTLEVFWSRLGRILTLRRMMVNSETCMLDFQRSWK